MIELAYKGKMPSGKNQQQTAWIRGRMVKYPNKKFKLWREDFQSQIYQQIAGHHPYAKVLFPEPTPVAFFVDYWPGDRIQRDLSGVMDAFFHASESRNGGLLVDNDNQFKVCLGWVEHLPDKKNPRFVIKLAEAVPEVSR